MSNRPPTARERATAFFPRTYWSDQVQAPGFDTSEIKPVGWIPTNVDFGRESTRTVLYRDGSFSRFRLATPVELFVEVRPGYWVEEDFERDVTFGDEIRVTSTISPVKGRLATTKMVVWSFGDTPIHGKDLRNISLTGIMNGISWDYLFTNPTPDVENPRVMRHLDYPLDGAESAKHGPSDAALRALATVHEVSEILGRPTVLEVAAELQLTRSTAGRWISSARKKGFLPDTGARD